MEITLYNCWEEELIDLNLKTEFDNILVRDSLYRKNLLLFAFLGINYRQKDMVFYTSFFTLHFFF